MRLFLGVWISTLGALMIAISGTTIAIGNGTGTLWAIVLAATIATDFGLGLAAEGWEQEG